MVIGLESQLENATNVLSRGARLDIVGSRGSGRSAFLLELSHRMKKRDYEVVLIRGIASLKSIPLSSLGLAGISLSGSQRASTSVAAAVHELGVRSEHGKLAIIIDDWDDVDEVTWGVVEAARRLHHIPVALGRLRGFRPRHTPSGLDDSTLESAFEIELGPLGFDEIESILTAHLGGAVDDTTMSRIFAKSGGIVGLALALVDAAVRDGRIAEVHGTWSARHELWSPSLRGMIESHIESLTADDRGKLEVLSLAGIIEINVAVELIGWPALERLESLGLLRVYPSADRNFATVFPPLIVEFFRHEPFAAHRLRLTEEIAELLGRPIDDWNMTDVPAPAEGAGVPDAVFIRLLQEQQRTVRLATQAEWTRVRSLSTGVRYLRELINSRAENHLVEQIIDEVALLPGSDEEVVRLAILRSRWLNYTYADTVGAVNLLDSVRPGIGKWGRLIDAEYAFQQMRNGIVPEDFDELTRPEDDLPDVVAGALWEVRAYAAVAAGRFAAAQVAVDSARTLNGYSMTYEFQSLEALIVMGNGQLEEATDLAFRLFDEGRRRLEINTIRVAMFAAAVCLTAQGKYAQIAELQEMNLALGDPPVTLQPEFAAIQNLAAAAPFRMGQAPTSVMTESRTINGVEGVLPGMSPAWAHAHQLLASGHFGDAASTLRTASSRLWDAGARLLSAAMMMTAVEINPDPDVLAEFLPRLREIEGRLVGAQTDYLVALVARDSAGLIKIAPELAQSGRPGLAVLVYRAAEIWSRRAKDHELEERAKRGRQKLQSRQDTRAFDDRRFPLDRTELSERELEIATLVNSGLTNQQVASALTLSIRTVESHVHRVMKKLQVESRHDLGEPLTDYMAGLRLG